MKNHSQKEIRFTCQQSGQCCCDPKIIVTLTFIDVYNLYQAVNKDFELLMRKLTFYRFEKQTKNKQRIKLVLPAVSTSDGEVIPSIKKINGLNCTFFTKPNCSIYNNRPIACQNYPFTFQNNEEGKFSWAKDAKSTCPGIGRGPLVEDSVVDKLRKITYKTINLHANFIQELNTEADRGKPLSAREVIWMFIVYGEKIVNQY